MTDLAQVDDRMRQEQDRDRRMVANRARALDRGAAARGGGDMKHISEILRPLLDSFRRHTVRVDCVYCGYGELVICEGEDDARRHLAEQGWMLEPGIIYDGAGRLLTGLCSDCACRDARGY
jgi:hypothetical protein